MKSSKIKLDLLPAEKNRLKTNRIKISNIPNHNAKELCKLLDVPEIRAMEIIALVEFQCIPSIGIKFAKNLISMGYYSLTELKSKNGARLIEDLEQLTDRWIDPCVEDQCRLVVDYAKNRDNNKKWWDYTEERKKYRIENGYPSNRPKKAWFEP